MGFSIKISILVILCIAFSGDSARSNSRKCNFPAIFNFGDSNSDTGGANVFIAKINWPNGFTVGKEFKRFSDGRLVIDFLAERLGLPYLNASADKDGTSFKYGANFAVGGNRINPDANPDGSGKWNYHLGEQVSRFLDFKSRALASKESTDMYPKPEAFSEAIYTIDIGQNDVATLFGSYTLPKLLDIYTKSVQTLLNNGAKYMWVHNTCPIGCLASTVQYRCPGFWRSCTTGNDGCIVEYNKLSQDFNSELKKRIHLLRKQYPNAVITLVDMYSAKHQLITNAQALGFDDASKFKYCCGNGFSGFCGAPNGQNVCSDPSKYLNWDTVHWTEAANKVLAKQIADGTFSQPQIPFAEACHKP